jgi:hypothetical protein
MGNQLRRKWDRWWWKVIGCRGFFEILERGPWLWLLSCRPNGLHIEGTGDEVGDESDGLWATTRGDAMVQLRLLNTGSNDDELHFMLTMVCGWNGREMSKGKLWVELIDR